MEPQISVTREQLPKLEEKLLERADLEKGLHLKPRVLDLERRVMAAKGDILANEGRVASLAEQARKAQAQIESIAQDAHARSRKIAGSADEASRSARRLLEGRRAGAGRRDVLSPHEGVVMNLKYTTLAASCRPEA